MRVTLGHGACAVRALVAVVASTPLAGENADAAANFVRGFVSFANGTVLADEAHADAGEIDRPGETFRHIEIQSKFGKMRIFAPDGHLPYPFGHELTGYEVENLQATLA